MPPPDPCPKCGHVRLPSDTVPEWQCPACGIAIAKFRAEAAKGVASANPLTAGVVEVLEPVLPPRLSFERRLGSATLDLLMAAVFLWCWIAPGAWRPAFVSELATLMLMEFLAIHSSLLMLRPDSREGGKGASLVAGLLVMLFYIPIAGAVAYSQRSWWAFFAMAWLVSSRVLTVLAGRGSADFEWKRTRFYWLISALLYVATVFAALFLPVPLLGFTGSSKFVWDIWVNFWVDPEEMMAWGFLYFSALGALKLAEKPDWIAQELITPRYQ